MIHGEDADHQDISVALENIKMNAQDKDDDNMEHLSINEIVFLLTSLKRFNENWGQSIKPFLLMNCDNLFSLGWYKADGVVLTGGNCRRVWSVSVETIEMSVLDIMGTANGAPHQRSAEQARVATYYFRGGEKALWRTVACRIVWSMKGFRWIALSASKWQSFVHHTAFHIGAKHLCFTQIHGLSSSSSRPLLRHITTCTVRFT